MMRDLVRLEAQRLRSFLLAAAVLHMAAATACSDSAKPEGSGGGTTSGDNASSGGAGSEGDGAQGGAGGSGGAARELDVDTSDPQLYEAAFLPDEVDSDEAPADAWLEEERAYLDTRAAVAGKLVVYLVGAGGKPSGATEALTYLAALGFHVVAPMYPNDYGIPTICPLGGTDDDCHRKGRLEAFEGVDHSPFITVTRGNSAEERIVRMLLHLQEVAPQGDWGYFLEGDGPRWGEIILVGHSHGASSAGLVGKVRSVHRVVMLSGPFDNLAGMPAPWTAMESLTSLDRFYGFSHTDEDQHAGHVADWASMGLEALGPIANIDDAQKPYSGSHQLVTSAETPNPHGSTTVGSASPWQPDGSYVFAPVWAYMLGR